MIGTGITVLTPAEAIALTKFDPENARDDMSTGDHAVRFAVEVAGILKVGEDYNQRFVAKADPWTMLSVALSKLNNVTIESIVAEALSVEPELAKAIKAKADIAIDALKAATVQRARGKVTGAIGFRKM